MRWWLSAAAILLVMSAATAVALGPVLACRHLATLLPMDLGHRYVLTAAATEPLPGRSQMTLALGPRRATALVHGVSGLWLPPGTIRSGATLMGTGQLPHDEVRFGWRVSVDARRPRPELAMRLTRAEANDLFAPYRRFPIDRDRGIFITYVLHDATIRDDDRPRQSRYRRRLRIDASGVVTLHWRAMHVDLPVRHLVGHLDWRFVAAGGKLVPDCAVTIDAVEADAPAIPFLPDQDRLWREVETRATRILGKHLARHPIPSSSPIESVVDVQIGDGPDTPAAAPRIAHPLAEL
jgi:hypothetical protein